MAFHKEKQGVNRGYLCGLKRANPSDKQNYWTLANVGLSLKKMQQTPARPWIGQIGKHLIRRHLLQQETALT